MTARESRLLLAAAVGLLAGAACASARPEQTADSGVTGCYQFERTREVRSLGLPWGFVLVDEPLEGWGNIPDGRVAYTALSPSELRDHPFGYWRQAAGDTVVVGHPGGSGFSLKLLPGERSLAGTARALGDVVPPGQDPSGRGPVPVTAQRVVCHVG